MVMQSGRPRTSENRKDFFATIEATVSGVNGYFGIKSDAQFNGTHISQLELQLAANKEGVKTAIVNGNPPVFVGDYVRLYVCNAEYQRCYGAYSQSSRPLDIKVKPFKLELLDPSTGKVRGEYNFLDDYAQSYVFPRSPGPAAL